MLVLDVGLVWSSAPQRGVLTRVISFGVAVRSRTVETLSGSSNGCWPAKCSIFATVV